MKLLFYILTYSLFYLVPSFATANELIVTPEKELKEKIEKHLCSEKISKLISDAADIATAENFISTNGELNKYLLQGKSPLTWVMVEFFSNKVEIQNMGFGKSLLISMDDKCQGQFSNLDLEIQAHKSSYKNGFTDLDLKTWLSDSTQGLIYVWSPYMPLSIKGLKEIHQNLFGQLKNIKVLILRDPTSSNISGLKALKKNRLPEKYNKAVMAIDFQFRGLLLHAPSWVIVKNGKFGKVISGYRNQEVLLAEIKK